MSTAKIGKYFVFCIRNVNERIMALIPSYELSALAYEKVKEMIVSKKLVPGKKIVQDKLAEELGISRTPLKAALKQLESENLVESIPRRGMIVKEYSNEEILDIYDCRMALEGTAVRLFTQNAEQNDINKLKSLFKPFQNGKIDITKYQNADSKFHNYILNNCGNKMLNQLFQQGNLLLCIDMIGLVRPPEQTLDEHLKIIAAIDNRDVDFAEKLAKDHLDKSKRLILEKIRKGEL